MEIALKGSPEFITEKIHFSIFPFYNKSILVPIEQRKLFRGTGKQHFFTPFDF